MVNTDQIVETIIRLNSAWLNRRYDDLRQFFHSDCILLPPPPARSVHGVDAMIESYRRFAESGTVHHFETLSTTCHEVGALLICHMRFRIDYEAAGGRSVEEGVEAYAVQPGTPPQVIWRTQLTAHGT